MAHPDSEAFFTALGNHIRGLRKERGWTVHYMVVQHGYYDPQWRKMEQGKGALTIDSLLKLCTIFGVSLKDFVGAAGDFPKLTQGIMKADAKQQVTAKSKVSLSN